MTNILIAPTAFKGSLTPVRAADAIRQRNAVDGVDGTLAVRPMSVETAMMKAAVLLESAALRLGYLLQA